MTEWYSESVTKQKNSDARKWSGSGDVFMPCEEVYDALPPAQYTVEYDPEIGYSLRMRKANLDNLIKLPDSDSEEVIEGINKFWTKEKNFRDLGLLWKRGILLWGEAGGGKTSTLQIISQNIVDKGGISVYTDNPKTCAQGLFFIRKIEPTRPIVVMIEDIDAVIKHHGEAPLLALLDGELQIDNVVFIATTNYPEDLDKRLLNRPSRFDVVKKIGLPTKEARKLYLSIKNPNLSPEDVQMWLDNTEGFSIAHLKELIISVECFGDDFDKSVKRLNSMINNKISSSDNDRGVGFT